MPSANQALSDRAIDHAINVLRFQRGVVNRLIALLNRTDTRLAAALAEALLQIEPNAFTVNRLERLLGSVHELNARAVADMFDELRGNMRELAGAEAQAQYGATRSAVPAAVQIQFAVNRVSLANVYAAALSRPFQGRLLSGWAREVGDARMRLIRNTITSGFVEGRTTADIIRSIRGTRANNFRDGVLERSRREVAAVVQTALSHTAQTARAVFYQANNELIKAFQWVSTLDNKTSPPCRVRDGLTYTQDYKPIGHAVPWGAGPGRLHFNCRSVSVPVLKSWRELGIDIDDLPASTRASMDGQVPADMNFSAWFGRQSAARQNEIVGAERAALFRTGRATFESFSDDRGKWLSLDELRARIP